MLFQLSFRRLAIEQLGGVLRTSHPHRRRIVKDLRFLSRHIAPFRALRSLILPRIRQRDHCVAIVLKLRGVWLLWGVVVGLAYSAALEQAPLRVSPLTLLSLEVGLSGW